MLKMSVKTPDLHCRPGFPKDAGEKVCPPFKTSVLIDNLTNRSSLELMLMYGLRRNRRLEAMSKELQELRDQRDTDHLIKRRPSTIDSPSQGSSGTSRYSPQDIVVDEFELDVDSLEIGGVAVEVQTAIEIFKV